MKMLQALKTRMVPNIEPMAPWSAIPTCHMALAHHCHCPLSQPAARQTQGHRLGGKIRVDCQQQARIHHKWHVHESTCTLLTVPPSQRCKIILWVDSCSVMEAERPFQAQCPEPNPNGCCQTEREFANTE